MKKSLGKSKASLAFHVTQYNTLYILVYKLCDFSAMFISLNSQLLNQEAQPWKWESYTLDMNFCTVKFRSVIAKRNKQET